MVGDRASDMVGGSANHVTTLGVLYGFGDRAELAAAHADAIVATPKELMAGIQQLLG
ncbi:HAD hydrolase-like protein [Lacticaseibacillus nasuensis]